MKSSPSLVLLLEQNPAKHSALREKALTKALAEALQIVEQISVDLAVDIVSWTRCCLTAHHTSCV